MPRTNMRARRSATTVVALLAMATVPTTAHLDAQVVARTTVQPDSADPLARAMSAEDRHDVKNAAINYRIVLQRALAPNVNDGDQASMALLGLERVWTEAGMQDSIMNVVERVLSVRRSDPIARVQRVATLSAQRSGALSRIRTTSAANGTCENGRHRADRCSATAGQRTGLQRRSGATECGTRTLGTRGVGVQERGRRTAVAGKLRYFFITTRTCGDARHGASYSRWCAGVVSATTTISRT